MEKKRIAPSRARLIGEISITDCEFDIIRQAMKALSRKEIADVLQKHPATIASQMRTLYLKTGIRKISGLIAWAAAHGFDREGNFNAGEMPERLRLKKPRNVMKPRGLKPRIPGSPGSNAG